METGIRYLDESLATQSKELNSHFYSVFERILAANEIDRSQIVTEYDQAEDEKTLLLAGRIVIDGSVISLDSPFLPEIEKTKKTVTLKFSDPSEESARFRGEILVLSGRFDPLMIFNVESVLLPPLPERRPVDQKRAEMGIKTKPVSQKPPVKKTTMKLQSISDVLRTHNTQRSRPVSRERQAPSGRKREAQLAIICSGPYLEGESFSLLEDLFRHIVKVQPDVLYMTGPFVEYNDGLDLSLDITDLFGMAFKKFFQKLFAYIRKMNLVTPQVYLVPSSRDITKLPIIPQSPIDLGDPLERYPITPLRNPSIASVFGLDIACINENILVETGLGLEETVDAALRQRKIIPNFPTVKQKVSLRNYKMLDIEYAPDVFIIHGPDDNRPVVKDSQKTLCIAMGSIKSGVVHLEFDSEKIGILSWRVVNHGQQ